MSDKSEILLRSHQLGLPLETRDEFPVWRPIHYLGSKLRLLGAIREHLADLDPTHGPVCDLFAGSGTVSMALSKERNVVAADIQEYSRVLCSALLHPAQLDADSIQRFLGAIEQQCRKLEISVEPIVSVEQRAMDEAHSRPELLCDIMERGSLLSAQDGTDDLSITLNETRSRMNRQGSSLLATRYFGGIYFSYCQALFIDAVLESMQRLPGSAHDTILAALLSTASEIVNSVGKHFAQPIRPRRDDGSIKRNLIGQICRDRRRNPSEIFNEWLGKYFNRIVPGSHQVMRCDYRDVLRDVRDVSVVYADPPYTRDHYSRFYHVLETLCRRDAPEISATFVSRPDATSRGLYRTDRHQSPFCIKSKAPGAFVELFAGVRKLGVPLLLSYSPFVKDGHPRLMTVDRISELARAKFEDVRVVPVEGVAHSKLNRSDLHLDAHSNAEVFILCR